MHLRIAILLFEKGDSMFTFDLKSGLHHVDIFPAQYNYLGVSWKRYGVEHNYVFAFIGLWVVHCLFYFHQAFEAASQMVV